MDSSADQIDVLDDGHVFVLLRCGTELRLSYSSDGARTFSTPVAVGTGLGALPDAATIFARSATAIFVLYVSSSTTASIVSSGDRGATWSAPVVVATNYANAGNGPALTLIGRGTDLFASWGTADETGYVSASANDGATWTALSNIDMTFVSSNRNPGLAFDDATGDLLYFNIDTRPMYRLHAGTWTYVGSMSTGTNGWTDFAGAGPWAYAASNGAPVNRVATTATFATFAFTTQTTFIGRSSMDADDAGDLDLAKIVSSTSIRVYRWVAGASTMTTTVNLTVSAGSSIPALASAPNGHAAVIAIYTSTANPISVNVQAY